MDILDQEAEEDETFQGRTAGLRPPSQEANQSLLAKEDRYREILEKAADSDEVVRNKWDEWESNITQLTWSVVCTRSSKRLVPRKTLIWYPFL